MHDLTKVLRKAIDRDPRSLYMIAKDGGLPYSTVHRFATLERSQLSLKTASALCQVLGLELRPRRRKGG
jgi:hypothetical protein